MGEKDKKVNNEPLRRYHEAVGIMKRLSKAYAREAWEDGEIFEDVLYDLNSFIEYEQLEMEVFEQAVVPVSKRANGKFIPDLRGLLHVCEYQKKVVCKGPIDNSY